MKRLFLFLWVTLVISSTCYAQDTSPQVEERLYNFDDMLIDGEFRDPQGMFERSRSESEFDVVLKLRRSFLHHSQQEAQESALKP